MPKHIYALKWLGDISYADSPKLKSGEHVPFIHQLLVGSVVQSVFFRHPGVLDPYSIKPKKNWNMSCPTSTELQIRHTGIVLNTLFCFCRSSRLIGLDRTNVSLTCQLCICIWRTAYFIRVMPGHLFSPESEWLTQSNLGPCHQSLKLVSCVGIAWLFFNSVK